MQELLDKWRKEFVEHQSNGKEWCDECILYTESELAKAFQLSRCILELEKVLKTEGVIV